MFILAEVGVALILVILLLIIIILQLLGRKTVVTVTVVSVATAAASYDHGDTVNISGEVTVDGSPQAGESVALKVVDSAETEYLLPSVTTDAAGKFTAAWIIPSEVAPGTCEVIAEAMDGTATATFTLSITKGGGDFMEGKGHKAHFELFFNKRKAACFRLRAPNGEIIVQSEAYSSKKAAENGIEAVKQWAPGAEIQDLT